MPRPIYIMVLGIAFLMLWGPYIIPGVLLVWMAASMESDNG